MMNNPFYVMRVKAKTVTAALQTLDSHKAEATGLITDAAVGGTVADAKVLSIDGVEVYYFVHAANSSHDHTFSTPIPIKAGQTIKLVSVFAAAGNHYATILGKILEEEEKE